MIFLSLYLVKKKLKKKQRKRNNADEFQRRETWVLSVSRRCFKSCVVMRQWGSLPRACPQKGSEWMAVIKRLEHPCRSSLMLDSGRTPLQLVVVQHRCWPFATLDRAVRVLSRSLFLVDCRTTNNCTATTVSGFLYCALSLCGLWKKQWNSSFPFSDCFPLSLP